VNNSPRLADLVRAGALYLTAQDAIALALENNIDLEISRYDPLISTWSVERAEAGGALPGVPNAASQAGSVAAGQGIAGSQAAAGVSIVGASGKTTQTANATVSQIGPVTQTLDPSIQETSTFSHTTIPQPNAVQSQIVALISNTRAHTGSYQQGFLTGGNITVRFTDNYLNENAPTDVLNPSSAPTLSISLQQNLLRGFGIAVNARTITVSKMNVGTSELNFKWQAIQIVSQVLSVYYGLSSDYDDLKAKENAADVAATFLHTVKRQIEVGTAAPTDSITAETQLVTSRQAVVDSRATLRLDEIRLKDLIGRNGTEDPLLATVRIVPVDKISVPEKEDLPPVDEMVRQAITARPDLAANKANEAASEVSILGTRNGVLPGLTAFGSMSNAGLSGSPRSVEFQGRVQQPDPYFVGGIGNALAQIFRRNFPSERVGAAFSGPLLNRQAQADYAIDELTLRQTQLTDRKAVNQVQVDLMNYVVAVQQTRARYEAAVANRVLEDQLFVTEQRKYALGVSTPYLVTQQQRDLVTAQSAEIAAAVSYENARIGLNQTLGRTLEAANVTIEEALGGKVARQSVTPAAP
jgi:outer membrane protein TolC